MFYSFLAASEVTNFDNRYNFETMIHKFYEHRRLMHLLKLLTISLWTTGTGPGWEDIVLIAMLGDCAEVGAIERTVLLSGTLKLTPV